MQKLLQTFQALQTFMGEEATTTSGGTVINVGQPVAMPHEGGFGDPDAQLMYVDGEVTHIEPIGNPEEEVTFDRLFDVADILREVESQGYGNPEAFGGVWDRVKGAFQSTTGKTSQLLNDLVRKVNSLVTKNNSNARKLKQVDMNVAKTTRRANAAYGLAKRTARVVNEEFGKKNRYTRAVLQAMSAIPGIRALNIFESEQFQDLIDYGKKVLDDLEDWAPKAKTSSTPYTLTATSDPPTVTELADRDDELLAAINAIREDVRQLVAIAETGGLEALEAFEEAKTASIVSELSKITPSQITRKEEAGVQMLVKYFFGQPNGSSNSLFNFSIG